ncbi:hypothetical protein GNF78_17700, partial [Clostridium perfringens]
MGTDAIRTNIVCEICASTGFEIFFDGNPGIQLVFNFLADGANGQQTMEYMGLGEGFAKFGFGFFIYGYIGVEQDQAADLRCFGIPQRYAFKSV